MSWPVSTKVSTIGESASALRGRSLSMSLSVFGAGSQPFMCANGTFDHSVCRDHVLDDRPDPRYETRGTCPLLEVRCEAPHAFATTRLVRVQTRQEVLEE